MREHRTPIGRRPEYYGAGEVVFRYPRHLLHQADERLMCIRLVCDRQLFGECYRRLLPTYFGNMPRKSGAFISGMVPTGEVAVGAVRPGDIDLLVIPYEGGELVLSRTLAIEVKVIRASYQNQGRSPNEYGFSQASHLMALGFPYVALLHLIVSDWSPASAWRKILVTQIIDPGEGSCEEPREFYADMLPTDLIGRAFGRLKANRRDERIGVVAAYMGEHGLWYPEGMRSRRNPNASLALLKGVEGYFDRNVHRFLDTPRYPPSW